MHKLLLTAAAMMVPAAPAFAQSYDRGFDSRGNTVVDASGLRVEARIGYERIISELNIDTATDSASVRQGKSGVTYGGEVGYDAQINIGTVLGIYGGIEGSSAKDCFVDGDNTRICTESGRNFTAGVRGGYLISPTTLLYIKGGYSNGKLRDVATNAAVPAYNYRVSDTFDGFHVGAGLQIGFSSNVYGKVEYVYTDYNGYEESDGTNKVSLDYSRHQVTTGIGVRF